MTLTLTRRMRITSRRTRRPKCRPSRGRRPSSAPEKASSARARVNARHPKSHLIVRAPALPSASAPPATHSSTQATAARPSPMARFRTLLRPDCPPPPPRLQRPSSTHPPPLPPLPPRLLPVPRPSLAIPPTHRRRPPLLLHLNSASSPSPPTSPIQNYNPSRASFPTLSPRAQRRLPNSAQGAARGRRMRRVEWA